MSGTDMAVIGAGPYGLSATAHLRARGVEVHTLGSPMDLWERRMPVGMLLRSSWDASSISDPAGALSLDAYEAERGRPIARPIPLTDFLAYGRWYQRRAVPDVDERRVAAVRRVAGGFHLELDDGDAVAARRVLVATGPAGFARTPEALTGVPAPLVRHSSELRELDDYRGRRTVVVGAGQSAIELAALLHEAGARVEVVARAPRVRWLRRSGWLHQRQGVLRRMLYPPTDVGPLGLSWLVAVPEAFRKVPRAWQEPIAYRCIRPAASGWLMDRTQAVTLSLGRRIASAQVADGALRLRLDDGSHRDVDRVVTATGFAMRADRHPLLAPDLLADLQTRDGAPLLRAGFESSVPGLHFSGAFAATSYGPVMRFVSGTPFAGRALARHASEAWRPPRLRSRPASAAA